MPKPPVFKAYGQNLPLIDVFPFPLFETRAPTATDRDFHIGQSWIYKSGADTRQSYQFCGLDSSGDAIWTIVGPGSSEVDTLTGDTGGPIAPALGNINILGSQLSQFVGSGNTLTLTEEPGAFPITPYVVGFTSDSSGYQTIQSALDACLAHGLTQPVYIQTGTYTENLTLYSGIDLIGTSRVSIIGVHTPPDVGFLSISNIWFSSFTDVLSSVAAGSSQIEFNDCIFLCQNGHICNLPNWTSVGSISMYECVNSSQSTSEGIINNTEGATINLINSDLGFGTGKIFTVAQGEVNIERCTINCPSSFQTDCVLNVTNSVFTQPLTTANNSIISAKNTNFVTGAAAAIDHGSSGTFNLANSVIQTTNNPSITGSGAGVLSLTDCSFLQNDSVAGTLTLSGDGSTRTGLFTTSGNISMIGNGTRIVMQGGAATDFIGTATLSSGTVTVSNTNIAATDAIFLQRVSVNGSTTLGELTYTISAGASFTITSAQVGTPGSTQTGDTSVVRYVIFGQQ